MATKITDLNLTTSVNATDNLLVYDPLTQDLHRATPGTIGMSDTPADWDETDTTSSAFIKNKPQVINQSERTKLANIENNATADQTSSEIKAL